MMHPDPHVYTAAANGRPEGTVALTSASLPEIATAPPPEFDGPGDVWSPETLLCASLADCFVLSFRAIARASKLEWSELECRRSWRSSDTRDRLQSQPAPPRSRSIGFEDTNSSRPPVKGWVSPQPAIRVFPPTSVSSSLG